MSTAVTLVANGGLPVTESNGAFGWPVEFVDSGGIAVTYADNGTPISVRVSGFDDGFDEGFG